jgi:hypothetical protein
MHSDRLTRPGFLLNRNATELQLQYCVIILSRLRNYCPTIRPLAALGTPAGSVGQWGAGVKLTRVNNEYEPA